MSPHISPTLLLRKPDEALVGLAKNGNDAAFAAIVLRYRSHLHRHCRMLLRDQGAEDAVQQTFIRALQALRSGTEVRDLRPWLYRIAHNVALKELGRRGWDHDELNEEWADSRGSDELERRAHLREALVAIDSLPARQRTALLQSAQGETPASIATALGVSNIAARQLVHRARVTVRAAVRVLLPPPFIWLARRASGAAERVGTAVHRIGTAAEKLPAPAIPAALAPVAPKVAVMVAAAALGAAPATLIASAHPGDAQSPAAMAEASARSAVNGSLGALDPTAPMGTPRASGAVSGGLPGAGVSTDGVVPSGSGSNPSGPGTDAGVTTDPTATDTTATDTTMTDATAPDPTATDAAAPDPTAPDPTATDPTATDPTATDTTTTDTTTTDTTTTDTTTTTTPATDTTATPTTTP